MQIKRYEAGSMAEALQRVKKELGPDAVILSAGSIQRGRGIFGKIRGAGVEVTAAVDTKPHAPAGHCGLATGVRTEQRSKTDLHPPLVSHRHRHILNAYTHPVDAKRRPAVSPAHQDHRSPLATPRMDMHRQLVRQNVKKEYASDIVSKLPTAPLSGNKPCTGDDTDALAAALQNAGVITKPLKLSHGRKQAIALVGPPGVGKTSTLAKLAAYGTLTAGRSVACVSLDNYRVAAAAQLKMYTDIIGVPMAAATTRKRLDAAMQAFKDHDLILIDTPAINRHDRKIDRHLARLFAKNPSITPHLLVSATSREEEQFDLINRLQHLSVKRLIVTKIDESLTVGGVVNLLIRSGLPWSYATAGQQVMGRLKEASHVLLADKLVGRRPESGHQINTRKKANDKKGARFADGANAPALAGYYVANRNSDVFHAPECKWTKMIKEEHIIVFGSVSEAEAKRFKPCRYCCPAGRSRTRPRQWPAHLKRAVGYR